MIFTTSRTSHRPLHDSYEGQKPVTGFQQSTDFWPFSTRASLEVQSDCDGLSSRTARGGRKETLSSSSEAMEVPELKREKNPPNL